MAPSVVHWMDGADGQVVEVAASRSTQPCLFCRAFFFLLEQHRINKECRLTLITMT
jgi:hypothetical protein